MDVRSTKKTIGCVNVGVEDNSIVICCHSIMKITSKYPQKFCGNLEWLYHIL